MFKRISGLSILTVIANLPAQCSTQPVVHPNHQEIFQSLKKGKKKAVFTLASEDAEFRSNCMGWYEDDKQSCTAKSCELLIHPKRDIEFDAAGVSLSIGAGSLVLLSRGGEKVSVYNLHDTKYGAVCLNEADDARLKLHVGETVTVSSPNGSISTPAPFTLDTIMKLSPLVLTMKCDMHHGDKALWHTLVKTYASLSMVRGDHKLDHIFKQAEAYNKGSLKVR